MTEERVAQIARWAACLRRADSLDDPGTPRSVEWVVELTDDLQLRSSIAITSANGDLIATVRPPDNGRFPDRAVADAIAGIGFGVYELLRERADMIVDYADKAEVEAACAIGLDPAPFTRGADYRRSLLALAHHAESLRQIAVMAANRRASTHEVAVTTDDLLVLVDNMRSSIDPYLRQISHSPAPPSEEPAP